MSTNTSSNCCGDCDNLGLPVGPVGDPSAPGFLSMSYTIAGSFLGNNTASYIEAGRFVFSNKIASAFSVMRTNIFVTGGSATLRIRDESTGNILYTNTNINSTGSTVIESITGLNVYDVNSAIIVVEFLHQTGGTDWAYIGSSTFSYT